MLNKLKKILGLFKEPEELNLDESILDEILVFDKAEDKEKLYRDYITYLTKVRDISNSLVSKEIPYALLINPEINTIGLYFGPSEDNRDSITQLTKVNIYLRSIDLSEHNNFPHLRLTKLNLSLRHYVRKDSKENDFTIISIYLESVIELLVKLDKYKERNWLLIKLKPVLTIVNYISHLVLESDYSYSEV